MARHFVWYELVTSDAAAAAAFYAKVVGWRMADAEMGGPPYTLAHVGERAVAGLMAFPPEMEVRRPAWSGYVAVADVDAEVARVVAAGGTQHGSALDIPGVGRLAVVADPQRASFVLFRGDGTPPAALGPMIPGGVGWHELMTSDAEAALAFYGALFGWEKSGVHDMGAMGAYQMFAAGGVTIGGMMTVPGERPSWRYYITVAAADAAVARLEAAGGVLVNGPMEVPGGSWIVHATDPQGAPFALVAAVR